MPQFRRISQAGIRFLEQQEGRVLRVYLDVSGIPTCGVGHVVRPEDNLHVGEPITIAQCEAFLAHDVGKCECAINSNVAVPITQNQFDAMVSLCFNIGVGGFMSSTVLKDLNTGNLDDERRAFELWDKDTRNGVLVVDQALLARRDREVALFMTPDEQEPEAA